MTLESAEQVNHDVKRRRFSQLSSDAVSGLTRNCTSASPLFPWAQNRNPPSLAALLTLSHLPPGPRTLSCARTYSPTSSFSSRGSHRSSNPIPPRRKNQSHQRALADIQAMWSPSAVFQHITMRQRTKAFSDIVLRASGAGIMPCFL